MANFFQFLQTKPNQFFPLCLPGLRWTFLLLRGSVSLVSEGDQLNSGWILKLLSVPRIFKLLNLCGNQLISIPKMPMSLFLLFLGKTFQQLNLWIWNDICRNCLLGHWKKIVKLLMRTFTCCSTFLYAGGVSPLNFLECIVASWPKVQPLSTKGTE